MNQAYFAGLNFHVLAKNTFKHKQYNKKGLKNKFSRVFNSTIFLKQWKLSHAKISNNNIYILKEMYGIISMENLAIYPEIVRINCKFRDGFQQIDFMPSLSLIWNIQFMICTELNTVINKEKVTRKIMLKMLIK